jgi:hypothetical protein
VKPYWQSDDGAITVYHARYEDVLAAGCVDVPRVALVHDDPPYGIGPASHRSYPMGRGWKAWPKMPGNDGAHDPSALLALDRPLVTWGADYYSSRLPDAATDKRVSWVVWDKREATTPDNSSDTELAWTNLGGPRRTFRHLWRGMIRASETDAAHLHPTQKPIALSAYIFQRARLRPGALVFVPHGGSGPDLPACRAAGLSLVWCDVERWCCDTAIARLGAVTAARAAEPAGPLFAARATVPA